MIKHYFTLISFFIPCLVFGQRAKNCSEEIIKYGNTITIYKKCLNGPDSTITKNLNGELLKIEFAGGIFRDTILEFDKKERLASFEDLTEFHKNDGLIYFEKYFFNPLSRKKKITGKYSSKGLPQGKLKFYNRKNKVYKVVKYKNGKEIN